MCPLRVILLFLSAMLAGYFAFKSVSSQGESSILSLSEDEPEQAVEETDLLTKVTTGVSSGFWVMIDMLSGRYLYQNLKGQTQVKGASSSEGLSRIVDLHLCSYLFTFTSDTLLNRECDRLLSGLREYSAIQNAAL